MCLSIEERIALRDNILNQFNKYSVYRMSRNNLNRAFKYDSNLLSLYNIYISEFRSEEEALYCLRYKDDISNHICPTCGHISEFYTNLKRNHYEYRKTCNNKDCIGKINHNAESIQKHKNTCKRLYGDENYTNREQAYLTCLLLYGDPHYTNRKKAKQTCLDKYGYEWLFQSPDFRKIINDYCQKTFGVDWYVETKEFKEKSKASKKAKYGDEYYNNIIQIMETNKRIRDHNWPMQDPKVVQAWRESYHKNNSVINPILITEIQPLLNIIKEGLTISEAYSNNDYFKELVEMLYLYKCRLLQINELKDLIGFTYSAIDQRVHELELEEYFDIQDSDLEVSFMNFLLQNNYQKDIDFKRHLFNLQTDHNTRQQLDFLMLNCNIAFEINDIMTHNITTKQNQYYHFNKTRMAKEQHNIRLIHLWEWELTNQKIQNWILHTLNRNKIQLNISECNIRCITKNEESNFLNQYSITPYQLSNVCYGFYYNNELVQIIYFNLIESHLIMNICTKFGYNVINGTKDIIDYYLQNSGYDHILTYVDLSKFTGKTFEDMGFKLIHYQEPNLITGKNNETSKLKQLYNCGYNVYILNK